MWAVPRLRISVLYRKRAKKSNGAVSLGCEQVI